MNTNLSYLHKLIDDHSVDALLITSPANIIYLTEYAGFSPIEREAFVLITKQENFIITDGRYSEAVKEHIPQFTLVERTSTFSDSMTSLISNVKTTKLGFEAYDLTVTEYTQLKKIVPMKPVSLENMRITKNENEVQKVKHACAIGDEAFTHLTSQIKPDMTEKDVALELEMFIRKKGAHLSFPTIAAFNKNSAIPHHHTSDKKLHKSDIILLDFGVLYDNYCSDMTRTIFIGNPSQEQQKVYETVLAAQQRAVEFLERSLENESKPIRASNVDKVARDYIMSQDFPNFSHALGHGIGIEVHEFPTLSSRSDHELKNGMVFSLEPGIYLPGKFGVRIEDLFTIQNGKLVQLTNTSPKLTVL